MIRLLASLLFLSCCGCVGRTQAGDKTLPVPKSQSHVDVAQNLGDRLPKATLGAVTNGTLKGDPFRNASPMFKGTLAYAFRIYKEPRAFNTIVQRKVGGAGFVTNYAIESIDKDFVFDPQFSPDGSFILFKAGNIGDPHSQFCLYVLDTQLRQLKQVSKRQLTYDRVLWSPDGRFIAYTEGGDYMGNEDGRSNPLRLFVCEWRTGRERFVIQNPGVQASFAWAAPHTLFYSAHARRASDQSPIRSDTWKINADQGKPTLVLRDAFRPLPSPDGRWLAFLGSPTRQPFDVSGWWNNDEPNPALCLARVDGTARRVLNRKQNGFSSFIWQANNTSVLSLDVVKLNPENILAVNTWDVATRERRRIGTLQTRDFENLLRHPERNAPIVPLQVSRDGGFLFVIAYPFVDMKSTSQYSVEQIVQAVDLVSGAVTGIATTRDATGLRIDWRADS